MPQLLYSQGKSPRYPLERRLRVPQRQSEHGGKEKKIPSVPLQESKPGCPAHSLVTILTEIPWLPK